MPLKATGTSFGTEKNSRPSSTNDIEYYKPPITQIPSRGDFAQQSSFTGTTKPFITSIAESITRDSSRRVSDSNLSFPIFWGGSRFCTLFCPSRGSCRNCGFVVHLRPGHYPPQNIHWPPEWKRPTFEIRVQEDGRPSYPDENVTEESQRQSSRSRATDDEGSHTTRRPSSSFSSSLSSTISSHSSSRSLTASRECLPDCKGRDDGDIPSRSDKSKLSKKA